MKKLKMWWIRLAFAALFLIAFFAPLAPSDASVATVYPYRIVIPSIGVNAGVVGTGLTSDGSRMAVPDNYTEVGWYSLGAKPGTKGSAVLGAHVDNGGRVPGVFKKLKNVKVGNYIYMYSAKGEKLTYKVVSRKVYDRTTPVTDEVFAQADASRLNLITCYGKWLPKDNTYAQRLVVFAKLVAKTKAPAQVGVR